MIYLIVATVCFSLSFGLIKNQLSALPEEFVVLARLFIAMLIFLPFLKKFNLKTVLSVTLIGILQFGIMYLAFLKAFKYLQGNEVALLTTTTPIFVAIWSVLFGEKFKFIYILCILMSVFGAGIIVWNNLEFEFIVKGILLMEISNCSFALGQVLWKNFVPEKEVTVMSFAYFGAVLFILPFMFYLGDFSVLSITKNQVLSMIYLAVVPTGIGFWLWNKGTKLVKASMLAIMNNLKIPFGVLFSIFIFGEKIDITNFLIGLMIIVCSIILLNYYTKKV